MDTPKIKNIAIIAHVDHGKTTLVDQMFRQSGMFRDNQVVAERMMDSLDLERERGITIASKNGSFRYRDHHINLVDTPGHADFGGQVERILKMVDGALLLVDAQEGPMPQTYYVLRKALALGLPIIVIINKIDKPAARPDWVVDQVLDLFVKLDAPEECLDYPILFASAKDGYATRDYRQKTNDITELFDEIIRFIPAPAGDPEAPLQLLVSSLSYSTFLGRLAVGKITAGRISVNAEVAACRGADVTSVSRATKIYRFEGTKMVQIESAGVGEIVALAGLDNVTIGETVTDPQNPMPLPFMELDPPTMSMNFIPNDSPFAGREGRFVTSQHLRERLYRETLNDVALQVKDMETGIGYKVSGRGELHLSILIEKMRREGYEFQVTRPEVIMKKADGRLLEPYEELTIDIDEAYMGKVIEHLGTRKGRMKDMRHNNGMVHLVYTIPTRGLLGFRNIFMEECTSVAYALFNLQERGRLFIGPQVKLYQGQIIGEHSRENDLTVNPARGKKLTNLRAAGSDENIILTPPVRLSLEDYIAFINDDELVELTPDSIRLRKIQLTDSERKNAAVRAKRTAEDPAA